MSLRVNISHTPDLLPPGLTSERAGRAIPPAAIIFDGDRWLTPEQLAREQALCDAATRRVNVAAALLGVAVVALFVALLARVLG